MVFTVLSFLSIMPRTSGSDPRFSGVEEVSGTHIVGIVHNAYVLEFSRYHVCLLEYFGTSVLLNIRRLFHTLLTHG